MIFLLPYKVCTVGDEIDVTRELSFSAHQRSPIITNLFNIYVDELAERLSSVHAAVSEHTTNLFTDEILVMEPSATGLESLLNISSQWTNFEVPPIGTKKCTVLITEP